MNPELHIMRSKFRRLLENELRKTNRLMKGKCLETLDKYIFIRYTSHIIDSMIDRNISPQYVVELFNKIHNHIDKVVDFVNTPDRPMRIEFTDGNLWAGFTIDKADDVIGLCCRMLIVNGKRLEGKIPSVVVHV